MSDGNSDHTDRHRKGGFRRMKHAVGKVPWMDIFRVSVELTVGVLQCLG